MLHRWVSWLNLGILLAIILLALGIGFIWIRQPAAIATVNESIQRKELPSGSFRQKSDAYLAIGAPALALQSAPPSLQLPDLRQQLIYYGKNGRPDAKSDRAGLHFSFNVPNTPNTPISQKTIASVMPGERLYLIYDRKSHPARYAFSPKNQPTSLWVEAAAQEGNEVLIKVCMCNDQGDVVAEPEAHAQFKLSEKEFMRYAGISWELGSWKVDGTLLARQRAKWFGLDRFLEKHGGDEYKELCGKSRVDFGEGEEIYSVFVGIGDCLIWDQNRWKVVQPGDESLAHPLLVVKKADERLMTCELWDVEGKGKVLLNLIKTSEPWATHQTQTIQQFFKFVGARTRTQYVFEVNEDRMVISPSDWLLLTQEGWKKLTTPEDIDDYVKRKTSGILFIFEGLTRKDDKQMMVGTLYNASRTDSQEIELLLQGGNIKPVSGPSKEREWEMEREDKAIATAKFEGEHDPHASPNYPPVKGPNSFNH